MSKTPGPVLVVDDDAAVRNSLKFALELEGLNVRLYGSGDELLTEEDLPASGCLVIDYYMPAMNGVELVRQGLRSHDPKLRGTALEYLESLLPEGGRAQLLSQAGLPKVE